MHLDNLYCRLFDMAEWLGGGKRQERCLKDGPQQNANNDDNDEMKVSKQQHGWHVVARVTGERTSKRDVVYSSGPVSNIGASDHVQQTTQKTVPGTLRGHDKRHNNEK